jgi:hypothetical protein
MTDPFDISFDRPVHGQELLGTIGPLARASWLAKHLRADDIYFMQDGTLSQLLFREVLSCYVAGHHIATIVLAFSLIERNFAGRLALIGDKSAASATSESLLTKALRHKWLSADEHRTLDALRRRRNPIVHYRDHLSDERPEVRAAISANSTEQLLEADAMEILEATIHVLRKTAL